MKRNNETMKGSARDTSDGAGLEWKVFKKGPKGGIRNEESYHLSEDKDGKIV